MSTKQTAHTSPRDQDTTPPPAATAPWHCLTRSQAEAALATDAQTGLHEDEALKRLSQYGPNAIRQQSQRSILRTLLAQFSDFMILVLIGAAVVSGLIGDLVDTIAIVVIVVLNAVIGFVQEFRAQRAIAALRKLAAVNAQVIRDGQTRHIPADELVPGDVVVMEAGNIVPADLRLLEAAHCKINEAALTGESHTSDKQTQPLDAPDLALGEQSNMAFKGTIMTYGRARALVTATGMQTEIGRIAALLETDGEVQTPLQKRLAFFGKRLAIAILVICALVFVLGLLRGEPPLMMLLTAISLAVAAIPEALPAVVTISLAFGARRMVRENALIRRLPAVETLGSVTWICTDKTGTLTQNRMQVTELYVDARQIPAGTLPGEGEPFASLLRALALSNDAIAGSGEDATGDPTEIALFETASGAGYHKAQLQASWLRVMEVPFDSERKRMTTVHEHDGACVAFTKGAPEAVLPLCEHVLTSNGVAAIDRDAMLQQADRMAAAGLRVLAIAWRDWPQVPASDDAELIENGLTLLALAGLQDPPRDEAHDAIALCKTAGITPVMITGDHPATARAIASRLHIVEADDRVVTGQELRGTSDERLAQQIRDIRVYARVDPAQKIRIVQALQNAGEIVAMTGDGVNDAPALKRADIGIAMGKGGTDVAREASSLVLLDDNFASIVSAVRAGRRIYDNIRKFIRYTMTSNSGEILTIVLAPLLGLPIPLLPIHILWINLVTDGLPGLALASEPAEKNVMKRPPRPPQEGVFSRGMWQHMLWVGLLMAGVSLAVQAYALNVGSEHWQTMVFTVLTLSQVGQVMALRSEDQSLFSIGLLSNKPLLGAVSLTFALQMATIYVPQLNPIFRTTPLPPVELALCLIASCVVFVAVEAHKWFARRHRHDTRIKHH
jgi:P-type Ca2+ transporter type 2C